MAYEYDIFISYRRSPTVGEWVKNHFLPRLSARIDDVASEPIRIFCDRQIASGANWPDQLKLNLKRSKLLLCVWSADYFRSPWCMAEWESFKRREEMFGLFSEDQPNGLVCPVRFADGRHYHPAASVTQCVKDFSSLNFPDLVFREAAAYLEFDRAIQELASILLDQLETPPDWHNDFPISEPEPLPKVQMRRPRN